MNGKHLSFTAICTLMIGIAGCTADAVTPVVKPQKQVEAVLLTDKPAVVAAKVDPQAPWPLFGGTPSRNMVNLTDKNIPTTWNAEEGKRKNIKWIAELGSHVYGGPVVADGKVFVGTNNTRPRSKSAKAVLMAFSEADGKFLWQIAHETPDDPLFDEGRPSGLCSTPVVEGKHLFYVTPGCEVIGADTAGNVQWTYDMMKELKVIPHHLANCSPLVVGDLVMVVTSNGTDNQGNVQSPSAPSFIAVNKKTGKLAWKSDLPGKNIIEGQWSNPALAVVNGKTQVIFPGGDNVVYGLEPETGKMIWKCDCNPMGKKNAGREMTPYMISTPVIAGDRLYVGFGVYPTHASTPRASYFMCLDVTKQGDVSLKSYDAKDPANKNSALVWVAGGLIDPPPEKGRQAAFGSTISTAAVHDGLAYITEEAGYLHCFDAKTGKRYWDHDFKASIWASPYYVDGKIYVGTQDGDVVIFEHGKERKYFLEGKAEVPSAKNDKRLPSANMDDGEVSTPVVANGVLYFVTKSKLIAVANDK